MTRRNENPVLTPKKKQIFEYIGDFIRVHNYSPTLLEIGAAAKLSSLASVHRHVEELERMKLITRVRGVNRSILLAGTCPACGRAMPKTRSKARGAAA